MDSWAPPSAAEKNMMPAQKRNKKYADKNRKRFAIFQKWMIM
jgi:hypothetical protein